MLACLSMVECELHPVSRSGRVLCVRSKGEVDFVRHWYLGLKGKLKWNQTLFDRSTGKRCHAIHLFGPRECHWSYVYLQYRQNHEYFNKSNGNVSTESHRPSHSPLLMWQNSHGLVNPTHSTWPTIN